MISCNVVLYHGTPAQQERIREVLEETPDSDDPVIADMVRRALDTPPDPELLGELLKSL